MNAPLLLTPGEPAGIGPDLAVMLAASRLARNLVVVADPGMLRDRAKLLGLALRIADPDTRGAAGELRVWPVALRKTCQAGLIDPGNAEYVLETLDVATRACLAGNGAGIVTGPVQKSAIADAGFSFMGQTEYIASLCGAAQPVMMLAAAKLRVALATTHLPLQAVPVAITRPGLEACLRVLDHDLRTRFGLARPRILVCGLNPHAGEGGHLGREEIETIQPVVEALRTEGMALSGPLPADTAFTRPWLARADAILAMYHDQGLPVLKALGFGHAVNLTLGLPIVRTSVDHGTALDLAGSGDIDSGSLRAAIRLAQRLSRTALAARA